MKASQLFTKTSKQVPADETAKNAQLLIKAGFIHKEMAGVYTFLPLGKRVLDNITQIVREEIDAIGGNEISMTALQPKDLWELSGRWDDKVLDVWFKSKLTSGSEVGLATTHEEPLTNLMRRFISSYKDLPAYVYQFQIKFRNELRSKSGLLRGKEFLMKDLYSFHKDQNDHEEFYQKAAKAYEKIFERLGIGSITYKTFASGGSFSKFSDEFQTISEAGEDTIYVHEGKKLAINKEVLTPEVLEDLKINRDELIEKRGIEVGNIFHLGTKYSEPLGLFYADENGTSKPVYMGSYGIGISRLLGTLAEHFADDKGLVWPENVAPFKVYIVQIGDSKEITQKAADLHDKLEVNGIGVLLDDRDERPGVKFADADLYGIPYRVVVSDKTVATGEYEVKKRTSNKTDMMQSNSLIKTIAT
jgi:prolyl-tRNA synthetase